MTVEGTDLKRVATDDDLERQVHNDATLNGHKRLQKILDTLTNIAVISMYVVPFVLATLYVLVLVHHMLAGEWNLLEPTLQSMIVPVTTYMAGLFSKNVLPVKSL